MNSDPRRGRRNGQERPPALAEWILTWLPEIYRDCILGDLEERFHTQVLPLKGKSAARKWYWKETLRAVNPVYWPRLGRFSRIARRLGTGLRWAARAAAAGADDLSLAWRRLKQSPGFVVAALLTLTLGIGATSAVFSLLEGLWLRPLPIPAGQRLVVLNQSMPKAGFDALGSTPLELEEYAQADSLEWAADYHSMYFTLLDGLSPSNVETGVVAWDFFEKLGVEVLHGRGMQPEDDRISGEGRLLLSYGYWQDHYGGSLEMLDKPVEMNNRPHRIIGILPPLPFYPLDADVYMPHSNCPFRVSTAQAGNRGRGGYRALALLTPGTGLEEARREVAAIAQDMQRRFPQDYPADSGFTATLRPLQDVLAERARTPLAVLFATVLCVFLIVCANLANLNLARLTRRTPEMALRSALGAGRGRLLGQLLTEGFLLASAAAVLGLASATASLELLRPFAQRLSVRAAEISIDGGVLALAVAGSILATLIFSLLPGLILLHSEGRAQGLTRRSRVHRAPRAGGLRGLLVVAQVAFSVVLLVAAGLMLQSVFKLQQVDPGFDPKRVMATRVQLNWTLYLENDQVNDFYLPLLQDLSQRPGVLSAALAAHVPLDGRTSTGSYRLAEDPTGNPPPGSGAQPQPAGDSGLAPRPPTSGGSAEDRSGGSMYQTVVGSPVDQDSQPLATYQPRPASQEHRAELQSVSGRYFEVMGIPVQAGQVGAFLGSHEVVVGRTLAARHWDDPAEALGKKLFLGTWPRPLTITAVVGDVHEEDLSTHPSPQLYVPFNLSPWREAIVLLHTPQGAESAAAMMRQAVDRLDPDQPLEPFHEMEELHRESIAPPRQTAQLLGIFALAALIVTATGIVGVTAYSASRRRHEFGVRMVFGANRRNILLNVLKEGLGLTSLGLLLGLPAALLTSRLLQELLFGVTWSDPATYLSVTVFFLLAAAAATLWPARRATSIDPASALRCE
ncbi:MAG TPA: ABC transporter permease [Acidobacteriota bacterium]|nr:ABC transporter permease [Acidobacteriota bacterium]